METDFGKCHDMNHAAEFRIKEIMKIAVRLDWCVLVSDKPYPIMQLSEVEKCMLAMADDLYLERMRRWERELPNKESDTE